VVRAVHDEGNTRSYHSKFADIELITDEIKVVFNVLLEVHHILKIIIVGEVANNDVGVDNDVFQKRQPIIRWQGKFGQGAGHKTENFRGGALVTERSRNAGAK
jgi:hypothetical protein